MKKQILLSSIICLISSITYSQSYIGHAIDNFSGIQGITYNPSSIVGSNSKADINLFSASIFGGSDYFAINVSDIIKSEGGFDFESDTEKFPSNANSFFFNADILGPSFMFNLSPKSSIGIISRLRANFNINNINGTLYESVSNNFDLNEDFDFDSKNLSGTIHAWGEIGFAYGRILVNKPKHVLKGGVTLKYLQGGGAIFMNTLGMQGQYDASAQTLTTQGELNYGTSRDFEDGDIDFSELSAGFGLDFGFTYQWHPNRENDTIPSYKDAYKLKIGVSVTDIGSVNYEDAITTTYDLNATVDASNFEDDTEAFLEDNYSGTETKNPSRIQLPTALHLLVDYRFAKKWFISAQANLSMIKDNAELSNAIINTVIIAPRLETKWFSFYAPLSLRQFGDVSLGSGLRFGPLTLGSGSVITNLLSDSSKTTDVYIGLKIPLYRK
ncbi:DUF5723 family protein [uncultured Winogradskyella sp.]|uniref:DUF5723 family protein n=1 Tax=uncultured Winogradskyella sp. TaxID=395353 RepID=UPI00261E4DB9|nr:DUF5723 family protein [uncultured Winogradskyella sp.]